MSYGEEEKKERSTQNNIQRLSVSRLDSPRQKEARIRSMQETLKILAKKYKIEEIPNLSEIAEKMKQDGIIRGREL